MREKRFDFRERFDWLRSSCINEPRGHDAIVGALLCESKVDGCEAGILFFNNVDVLNGCVHGTIGVAETLHYLGRLDQSETSIETPVGIVKIQRGGDGTISVRNVRSYRAASSIAIEIANYGKVTGDIAWGGNWFFLIDATGVIDVDFANLDELTRFTIAVRTALNEKGITGDDGAEIDHIEVFGPPTDPALADSKNFVLCPGKAYDRSPCGTGTSAKLACLAADGKLKPGEVWRQAGILDSVFNGTFEISEEGGIIPTISGSAYITGEVTLILNPKDPFCNGIQI